MPTHEKPQHLDLAIGQRLKTFVHEANSILEKSYVAWGLTEQRPSVSGETQEAG